jgi:hypothetical protein
MYLYSKKHEKLLHMFVIFTDIKRNSMRFKTNYMTQIQVSCSLSWQQKLQFYKTTHTCNRMQLMGHVANGWNKKYTDVFYLRTINGRHYFVNMAIQWKDRPNKPSGKGIENMHFAAELLSFWALPILSNSDQKLAPFPPWRWQAKRYLLWWVSEKGLFSTTFPVTENTIHISHEHHKHDKAYYSCSSKRYLQKELFKFTVCLLIFKIMPQYLTHSNQYDHFW